jgi:uncharacterized membrane protein HdeD (DUF308 family)
MTQYAAGGYDAGMPSSEDISDATSRWWLFLIVGLASVAVGMVLLFDLVVAVETLALFIAFGLIFSGVEELLGSRRYRRSLSVAAGALLLVAGTVAMAWPGITVWALAVVTAAGLIVSGALRATAALIVRAEAWGWLFIGGLVSLVVGGMAMVWPDVTVMALALLLGIRMVVFGVVEIASALQVRSLGRSFPA